MCGSVPVRREKRGLVHGGDWHRPESKAFPTMSATIFIGDGDGKC